MCQNMLQLIAHFQKQAVAIRPVDVISSGVQAYSLKEIIKCVGNIRGCVCRVLIRRKIIKHPDTSIHAFIFLFYHKILLFYSKSTDISKSVLFIFSKAIRPNLYTAKFPIFFQKRSKKSTLFPRHFICHNKASSSMTFTSGDRAQSPAHIIDAG